MKNRSVVLAAVLVAGLAVILIATRREAPRKTAAVDSQAPVFLAADARTGRQLTPADLKGKVVFVNFWASWCQPCKDEMPSIDALYRELAADPSFVMVTLLYKDSPADGLGYLKAMGFNFPVFMDNNGDAARDFGVTGVPETYLIDKKGVLRQRVIGGAEWNSPEAKSRIYALLRE